MTASKERKQHKKWKDVAKISLGLLILGLLTTIVFIDVLFYIVAVGILVIVCGAFIGMVAWHIGDLFIRDGD